MVRWDDPYDLRLVDREFIAAMERANKFIRERFNRPAEEQRLSLARRTLKVIHGVDYDSSS